MKTEPTDNPSSRQPTPLEPTEHYHFDLPKELIAQEPLANREDARLMTINRESQSIDHFHIRDLDEVLRPGDCLVLNDTKVSAGQAGWFSDPNPRTMARVVFGSGRKR